VSVALWLLTPSSPHSSSHAAWGKVARALTWHRAIGGGGPDEVEPAWIRGPIESMVSLLDDSYLGLT
jgi:hypothetical protein